MKHIKLFESYGTPNVYTVVFGTTSGPDYIFENLLIFSADNSVAAKDAFLNAMDITKEDLHDRNTYSRNPEISDEFIQEVLDDGYYTGAGWSVYGHLLGVYPAKPGLNFKNKEITLESESDDTVLKDVREEVLDELLEIFDWETAGEILFRLENSEHQIPDLAKYVVDNWKSIPMKSKSLVFHLHPSLSPGEIKKFQAVSKIRKLKGII